MKREAMQSLVKWKSSESRKPLIVLDEIQEAPRAITCLKYFCENAPEYYIVSAGSFWHHLSITVTFCKCEISKSNRWILMNKIFPNIFGRTRLNV